MTEAHGRRLKQQPRHGQLRMVCMRTCSVSQCMSRSGGTRKPEVTASTRPLPPTPAAASSAASSALLRRRLPPPLELLLLSGVAASRQTMR